jgi:hypothetical protein
MLEFACLLLFLLVIAAGMLLYQIMSKMNMDTASNIGFTSSMFIDKLGGQNVEGGTNGTLIVDFANYYVDAIQYIVNKRYFVVKNYRLCFYYLCDFLLNRIGDEYKKIIICVSHSNHLPIMKTDAINIQKYIKDSGYVENNMPVDNSPEFINTNYLLILVDLYKCYIDQLNKKFKNKNEIEFHIGYAPYVYCENMFFSPDDFDRRREYLIPPIYNEKHTPIAYSRPDFDAVIDSKLSKVKYWSSGSSSDRRDVYKYIYKGILSRDDYLCLLNYSLIDNSTILSNDMYLDIKFINDYSITSHIIVNKSGILENSTLNDSSKGTFYKNKYSICNYALKSNNNYIDVSQLRRKRVNTNLYGSDYGLIKSYRDILLQLVDLNSYEGYEKY